MQAHVQPIPVAQVVSCHASQEGGTHPGCMQGRSAKGQVGAGADGRCAAVLRERHGHRNGPQPCHRLSLSLSVLSPCPCSCLTCLLLHCLHCLSPNRPPCPFIIQERSVGCHNRRFCASCRRVIRVPSGSGGLPARHAMLRSIMSHARCRAASTTQEDPYRDERDPERR